MNKNCILLEIKLHFVFSDNFYQVFFLKRPEHCVSKKMLTLFTNLQLRNKRLTVLRIKKKILRATW